MPAMRCSMCGRSWPSEFPKCPQCLGKNDPVSNVEPDCSSEEAEAEAKSFAFDRYYARWNASKDSKRLTQLTDDELALVPSGIS